MHRCVRSILTCASSTAVVIAVSVGACLLIAISVAFGVYLSFDDWTERGQFGDMFGVVNTMFSGFALIGVIVAIVLQMKELKLQRDELHLTREELKRSATAHEESQRQLTRQADAAVIATRISSLIRQMDQDRETIRWLEQMYVGRSNEENQRRNELAAATAVDDLAAARQRVVDAPAEISRLNDRLASLVDETP